MVVGRHGQSGAIAKRPAQMTQEETESEPEPALNPNLCKLAYRVLDRLLRRCLVVNFPVMGNILASSKLMPALISR